MLIKRVNGQKLVLSGEGLRRGGFVNKVAFELGLKE